MHHILLRSTPILMVLCLLAVRGTTGYVVLTPPQSYTVFEDNASAVFYCSGDGSAVVWVLNGSTYGLVHLQRGITFNLSGAGATITSNLYIPASATNNNTEVICKVIDGTFTNVQTSNPSNLTVQGPLDAPYNFSVAMSNTSYILSWGAPFSLDVTGYYTGIFNYTLCTNITIYGCKTIPNDPDCTFPRTCTSSVDFTDPLLNGTNKTIMDYGDPIKFTIFAINGAGNGTLANLTSMYGAGSTTQTFPSPSGATVTIATSFTYMYSKSETSIAALVVGVTIGVTGAVVLIVFSIGIAIKCYIYKRKARYPCLPPSDCKPTCTSESQLKLQNKVKLDTPCYTDVVCLQVITIPAPNGEVQYSEVKAPHTEEVKFGNPCYTEVVCHQIISIPVLNNDQVQYEIFAKQ